MIVMHAGMIVILSFRVVIFSIIQKLEKSHPLISKLVEISVFRILDIRLFSSFFVRE
jgi:hypothetical protein